MPFRCHSTRLATLREGAGGPSKYDDCPGGRTRSSRPFRTSKPRIIYKAKRSSKAISIDNEQLPVGLDQPVVAQEAEEPEHLDPLPVWTDEMDFSNQDNDHQDSDGGIHANNALTHSWLNLCFLAAPYPSASTSCCTTTAWQHLTVNQPDMVERQAKKSRLRNKRDMKAAHAHEESQCGCKRFKMDTSDWKCPVCGNMTANDETICGSGAMMVPDPKKPGHGKQCNSFRSIPGKLTGWGDAFTKMNKNKWQCKDCKAHNDNGVSHCKSCETANLAKWCVAALLPQRLFLCLLHLWAARTEPVELA